MEKKSPFSLKIFVADGDPDGLRLVERSNWIGKCVMFPRTIYPKIRARSEFQQTGVYVLLDDRDTIYIGEGDPVRPRFEQHFAKKDFWTRAVFFVAGPGQLNKAHVQYLEAELVERARTAKKKTLENGNIPARPTLSEADIADMDVFLDNMLGLLPVLGIDAFEKADASIIGPSASELIAHGRGVTARGRESTQGFIVVAGSQASKENTPSLTEHFGWICRLKEELVTKGVLAQNGETFVFTQDYVFTSPSTAGAVVLGRASNGRVDWKDSTGRTLKEIQEAQTIDVTPADEIDPGNTFE